MTKPLPALGLVVGVIVTYVALGSSSYATPRLIRRLQTFREDLVDTLPWLALLIVIAVVLGLLMIAPAIGAGVTTGSGLLLTAVGVAAMVLPMRQSFDLLKLFEFPGAPRFGASYFMYDGAMILLGIPLLLVGIRRWTQEAKLARLPQPAGLGQGGSGYQSTYPQQTQQWGGYPGQQPYQPPQPHRQPQDQPRDQQPGQQPGQPPQYPGQQQ